MKRLFEKKVNFYMTVGLLLVLAVVVFAVAVPLIYHVDPDQVDPANRLLPIGSVGHPMGTDHLGRDMLIRVADGTRLSLITGAIAAVCAAFVGISVGLIAAMNGKMIDNVLMRIVDMIQAFPEILLAVLIVGFMGASLRNAMLAVFIVRIPFYALLTRSVTLSTKEKDYIQASRALGNGKLYITIRHVLPNISGYLVSQFMMNMGSMLTTLAALSFLGLGAQPPMAELGSMLGELRSVMLVQPGVVSIPGIVILVTVFGFNLLGDGLRDYFDPKLN